MDLEVGAASPSAIGRVAFKYGMREFGPQMGLTETAFRLLPLTSKIRMGGQSLADLFNRETDQRVRIEEANGKLLWDHRALSALLGAPYR